VQMTVSQMTLTSTEESRQQRLPWLAERVMNCRAYPSFLQCGRRVLDNRCSRLGPRRSATGEYSPCLRRRHTSPIAADERGPGGRGVVAPRHDDRSGVRENGTTGARRRGWPSNSQALGDRSPRGVHDRDDARLWPARALRACGAPYFDDGRSLHREDGTTARTADVARVTGHPAQTAAVGIGPSRLLVVSTQGLSQLLGIPVKQITKICLRQRWCLTFAYNFRSMSWATFGLGCWRVNGRRCAAGVPNKLTIGDTTPALHWLGERQGARHTALLRCTYASGPGCVQTW